MLRARETFHYENGSIAAGEPVADSDEIVTGREHLFEPVEDVAAKPRAAAKAKPAGKHATGDGQA